MTSLSQRRSWPDIISESRVAAASHLRDLFAKDPQREARFSLRAGALFLDYSRERVTPKAVQALVRLAEEAGVASARHKMFTGGIVNESEKRLALHIALRKSDSTPILVGGKNVMEPARAERTRLLAFAEELRAGKNGIKHIIHVGIGGSEVGPRMLAEIFADGHGPLVHFVANADAGPLQKLMAMLKPEETAVLLASKSFTTAEVLLNGRTLLAWLKTALGDKARDHLLAATAAPMNAIMFGVKEENIFPLWDWVGGRFSVWSAVSLAAIAAMGAKAFEEFLQGGAAMDKHFAEAPPDKNMPVLLALLSVWNMNALSYPARAVLPYAEKLALWPVYLQQLEMESLGKSVGKEGKPAQALTAPLLFGATGTPAQHAFMQALHQGPQIVPAEILLVAKDNQPPAHRQMVQAHALAQAEALAFGRSDEDVRKAEPDPVLAAQKSFPGNRPSSILVLDELSPRAFGELVALYEHKVFAQAMMLNLNPFDQWGVELGKKLAGPLEEALKGGVMPARVPAIVQQLKKN